MSKGKVNDFHSNKLTLQLLQQIFVYVDKFQVLLFNKCSIIKETSHFRGTLDMPAINGVPKCLILNEKGFKMWLMIS